MTLDELGLKYGTDKASNHHDYLRIYEKTFGHLRKMQSTFLEIGYGGFSDPDAGGESIKMWREYFPCARIACIDLYAKNIPENTSFLKASQDDKHKIEGFIRGIGNPRIIIDDASHLSSLTIKSFEILFPLLQSGGYYCIEDIHSSYHDWFYGKDQANENPRLNGKATITAMNYFKGLSDSVNYDFLIEKYRLPYSIESITFHRDLIIIEKK